MEQKEIIEFCIKNGLLVDTEILTLLSEVSDLESVKLILEIIKSHSGKKFISKQVFYENKEQVKSFFSSLPQENQESLQSLKIKLGLSIEISQEILTKNLIKSYVIPEKQDARLVKVLSANYSQGRKFGVEDFVATFRNRFSEIRNILQERPGLDNLVSINKISGSRQGISLVGIVYDKRVTKNKNIIFEVEDLTGRIKILINKDKEDLVKKAENVVLDSVLGFKGSGNKEIIFASDIVFPETFLLERKKSFVEEYAAFIGDVHYGSKKFFRESFLKFIDYLNGKVPNTPEVSKIKYLFIVGDLVTGVGVYPDQEKDLEVPDLERQFREITELLSKIRKDITIILSPGNHDGVRLMEPQPLLDEKYAWPLHEIENVILTENPSLVNIGARDGFSGLNVLTYHGFSYPYYADNVPDLIKIRAMNSPEKIMEFLLMQRHLAPTQGSTQYFPNGKDIHVIKEVPDIFLSGHTHKSAVTYCNNVLVISVSTWEAVTAYQEKFGNIPDHCKVPLLNLKTRAVKILDFEQNENSN